MAVQRLLRGTGYALSAVLVVVGGFLAGLYFVGVAEIFVEQPPDRSWLFWGLPLAFIGLGLLVSGVVLAIAMRSVGRKERKAAPP